MKPETFIVQKMLTNWEFTPTINRNIEGRFITDAVDSCFLRNCCHEKCWNWKSVKEYVLYAGCGAA